MRITYVLYYAKIIKIVKMVNFVPKEDVFLQFATNNVIVDRATYALLKNASLDVSIKDNVRLAKTVLITIVPFHQVIISI